jgi:hypothetical protein
VRSLLFAVAILLALGVIFARERVKLAFQVGAALYGVLLVFRFLVFSRTDPENLQDLAAVLLVFGLFWLTAWGLTQAILRYRKRAASQKR